MRLVDRVGHTYGRLTVVARAESTSSRHAAWLCLCQCGAEVVRSGKLLANGDTRSCGCLRRERVVERNSRGDEVTYKGQHERVARLRGRASSFTCHDCTRQAEQWSYVGGCDSERRASDTGYRFCPHVEHYQPRDRKCHYKFDGRGERRQAGTI